MIMYKNQQTNKVVEYIKTEYGVEFELIRKVIY